LGLAFHEIARDVVRAVNDDLVLHFSYVMHLLNFGFELLHLWSFLARLVEFQ
jgi:hypothetical protein